MFQKKFIYVLQLKNGYYYVGSTSNPDLRLENHIKGEAYAWTVLHPLISNQNYEISVCNI